MDAERQPFVITLFVLSSVLTKQSPAEAELLLEPRKGGELDRDRGKFGRIHVDEAAVLALVLEADDAVHLGEQGVVLAAADVGAWLQRGAALTDDDASTEDRLTAEYLNSEPLSI